MTVETKKTINYPKLFALTEIPEQEGSRLLSGASFVRVRDQIIFKNNDHYVITTINEKKKFSAKDYAELPENAPYQLVNGKLIFMPSPIEKHQRTQSVLQFYLFDFIDSNNLGKIYSAPFDVYLDDENVYQPDLMFISKERAAIVKNYVYGAPDLVIEIVSKGTEKVDRKEKLESYGKFGVSEYWIIDPRTEEIDVFYNEGDKMKKQHSLKKGETLVSKTLKDFSINTSKIFR